MEMEDLPELKKLLGWVRENGVNVRIGSRKLFNYVELIGHL